jgi:glucose-6-phosphate 1-dehydrogenase
MAESTTLLVFGATEALARSKLWRALHDLAASGRLPRGNGRQALDADGA